MRRARREPRTLAIGVDTSADNLRDALRAVRKQKLTNARFVISDATTALRTFKAHEVQVILPWGSLLRSVLEAESDFVEAVVGAT